MSAPSVDAPLAPETRAEPVLSVSGLQVRLGGVHAVRGVDLEVRAGECLALVGASGSGKSVTARALLGLAGSAARVSADAWRLAGEDASSFTAADWRRVRGRHVGLVLQDALNSLDPLQRIGSAVAEPLAAHDLVPRAERPARARELLAEAGIPDPDRRARQYPFELSGGLRQRALIASAVGAGPRLLVADEPTTALDVVVQQRILALFGDLVRSRTGLLLITHDLAVAAGIADRIAVLDDGRVVEHGPAATVLADPQHDRTRALLAAVRPSAGATGTRPPPRPSFQDGLDAETVTGGRSRRVGLLEVRGVSKGFSGVTAVSDVSLTLTAGETLGLVGGSGSGKSTLARIVLGLLPPDDGTVAFEGEPWSGVPERQRRERRRRMAWIHQNPLGSFDPRWRVDRIVAEALPRGSDRRTEVTRLLEDVGLRPEHLDRRPAELSGGQRQRVAIARALAGRPDLLVCDEPVSALDAPTRAQILALLDDLRRRQDLALLFISHDLGVVREVCDRVLILDGGVAVETGPVADVFTAPQHPATRRLLEAVPVVPS